VLTQLWFPRHYLDLSYGFDPRASWLVLARDLVLVALLLVLAWANRVALLVVLAGALAATGAAAAVVTSPKALAHTTVLDETGVASTCRRVKPTPPLGAGTVRYGVTGYENTGAAEQCVSVTIHSTKRQPLFSAAYRDGFYPVDPGRNYLGDAGTCTNVPQHPASSVTYSIRVPARTRFAVEVEQCTSNRAAPSYSVNVTKLRRTRSIR
jgi:hypothetical protein